jgi:iron(III) transport system permease protein
MSRRTAWILLIAVTVSMAVGFVYPAFSVLQEAFIHLGTGKPTLDYLGMILEDPVYREGLANSLLLGLCTTFLALAIALPLAVLNHRHDFPLRRVLALAVLAPMILPPFVGAVGIKHIIGVEGSLNAVLGSLGLIPESGPIDWMARGRFAGIVLMNSLCLYPILYLNLSASLAQLDPALEQAAENLGCRPWRRFLRITLPLILPGMFAGGSLVFIWAFTDLGVPLVFDYTRVASVQILDGIKGLDRNPLPYALTAVVLIVAATVFLLSKLLFGGKRAASAPRPRMQSAPARLGGLAGWACTSFFVGITFIATLPHLGVLMLSIASRWHGTALPDELTLAHWEEALGSALVVPSIQNSLAYAGTATLIALFVGLASAWVVVRSDLRARHLLDTLTMMPLAVPGLVLAFGYLALSQEGKPFHGLIGDNGSPFLLLALAYAMRRLPYVMRSSVAGLQQSDPVLEQAARSLGASAWSTFRRISLPLLAAHLAAGCILAFAFAMLEVSDSLILAQQAEHYPITKATFALLTTLGNGTELAAALGVWSMVFLSTALIGAALLGGKRGGLSG